MTGFQTKLSADEKVNVREMIVDFKNFGGFVFHYPESGLTVAMYREFPDARMMQVGIAQQAPTETKFRKLVGAMYAIERANMGSFPSVVADGYEESFAADLRDALDFNKKLVDLTPKAGPFPV